MTARELAKSRNFLQVADVDLIQKGIGMIEHPVMIADLGAGSGTTVAAAFESAPEAVIWTVDVDPANLDWAQAIVRSMGTHLRWNPLMMDSVAAAAEFDPNRWDFVMIDTSHEYEHTKAELAAWLPRLNPGGLIWLHDYIGYDGVKQAVDELLENGTLAQLDQSGLGILVRPL